MASVGGLRLVNYITENVDKSILKSVPALTLDTILSTNKVTSIDLLSLDAEGYEFEILNGLNLNKYRPKYILIEIYITDYNNIINYLKDNNYELVSCFSNFNKKDNPGWDETHQDYLFIDLL